MSKKIEKLTTSSDVEDAFIKLFNRIDSSVNHYIRSAVDGSLKRQAIKNAVGMLNILETIYKKDLQLAPGKERIKVFNPGGRLRLHQRKAS
jgi:hypothetical protein